MYNQPTKVHFTRGIVVWNDLADMLKVGSKHFSCADQLNKHINEAEQISSHKFFESTHFGENPRLKESLEFSIAVRRGKTTRQDRASASLKRSMLRRTRTKKKRADWNSLNLLIASD